MIQDPVRTCAVCESDSTELVSKTTSGDYFRCQDCGFEVRGDAKKFAERFAQAQRDDYDDDSLCLTPLFISLQSARSRRRASVVNRHLPAGRLIEVGPGIGEDAALLVSRGYKLDLVEHSAVLAEAISDRIGIRPLVGEFEQLDLECNAYDGFLSFHVIEHVADMAAHLAQAAAVVRPGGFAFIATPNAESWEHRLLGRDSPNYSFGHVRLFTAASLATMMSRTGWEFVEAETPAYSDALVRAVTAMFRRLRGSSRSRARGGYARAAGEHNGVLLLRLISMVSWPLRVIQEKLNRGNEILVVARRQAVPMQR